MCFLDLQPALSTSFAVQQRTTRPVRRPLDAVLRAAPECSTQSRWVYIDTCMSPHRHTLIKRIGHESSTFVSVDPFQTPISSPAYVLKLLICSASELRPRVATKSSQLDRRPPHLKPTPPGWCSMREKARPTRGPRRNHRAGDNSPAVVCHWVFQLPPGLPQPFSPPTPCTSDFWVQLHREVVGTSS